jgi:hypothetical protein
MKNSSTHSIGNLPRSFLIVKDAHISHCTAIMFAD